MKIQSINQNNYQNNYPQKNIAFKENFCIVKTNVTKCPLKARCENVVREIEKRLAALIAECQEKTKELGDCLKYAIPEENGEAIYIFDQPTSIKLIGSKTEEEAVNIFTNLRSGQTGKVINFDTQKICDELKPTEISCRGKYVSIGARKNENPQN